MNEEENYKAQTTILQIQPYFTLSTIVVIFVALMSILRVEDEIYIEIYPKLFYSGAGIVLIMLLITFILSIISVSLLNQEENFVNYY